MRAYLILFFTSPYAQSNFAYTYRKKIVTLVLPIPDPQIPEQHEPWCPLGKDRNCTQICIFFKFNT